MPPGGNVCGTQAGFLSCSSNKCVALACHSFLLYSRKAPPHLLLNIALTPRSVSHPLVSHHRQFENSEEMWRTPGFFLCSALNIACRTLQLPTWLPCEVTKTHRSHCLLGSQSQSLNRGLLLRFILSILFFVY